MKTSAVDPSLQELSPADCNSSLAGYIRATENPQSQTPSQGRQAVGTNHSTVEAVVKSYFDALYEGDADKMGTVFDASADLRWIEKGKLQVLKVPEWLDRTRKRPSAKAEGKPREDFVVTIDRSDDQT